LDDDDFEPLECSPLPVAIEAYDVETGGRATVRVFFEGPGGLTLKPGGELSNVVVLEQWDRVAVALVRRHVHGDAPDGLVHGGEALIRGRPFSLDVVLREPLGTRPLIDASTGDTIPRLERTSADLLPGEEAGTPRWIPF
jgi:hypothetical protein